MRPGGWRLYWPENPMSFDTFASDHLECELGVTLMSRVGLLGQAMGDRRELLSTLFYFLPIPSAGAKLDQIILSADKVPFYKF